MGLGGLAFEKKKGDSYTEEYVVHIYKGENKYFAVLKN